MNEALGFIGKGCLTEFVATWNDVFKAMSEARVLQEKYLGRKAVFEIGESRFVIQF